jgi:hypothetical protein
MLIQFAYCTGSCIQMQGLGRESDHACDSLREQDFCPEVKLMESAALSASA